MTSPTQYIDFSTQPGLATLSDTPPANVESWPVTVEALRGLVDGGWRPIESAPRDGTVVLVYGCSEDEWEEAHDEPRAPERVPFPAYVSIQKSIWWMAGGLLQQVKGATHWQPLPPPPAQSAAEEERVDG